MQAKHDKHCDSAKSRRAWAKMLHPQTNRRKGLGKGRSIRGKVLVGPMTYPISAPAQPWVPDQIEQPARASTLIPDCLRDFMSEVPPEAGMNSVLESPLWTEHSSSTSIIRGANTPKADQAHRRRVQIRFLEYVFCVTAVVTLLMNILAFRSHFPSSSYPARSVTRYTFTSAEV